MKVIRYMKNSVRHPLGSPDSPWQSSWQHGSSCSLKCLIIHFSALLLLYRDRFTLSLFYRLPPELTDVSEVKRNQPPGHYYLLFVLRVLHVVPVSSDCGQEGTYFHWHFNKLFIPGPLPLALP